MGQRYVYTSNSDSYSKRNAHFGKHLAMRHIQQSYQIVRDLIGESLGAGATVTHVPPVLHDFLQWVYL